MPCSRGSFWYPSSGLFSAYNKAAPVVHMCSRIVPSSHTFRKCSSPKWIVFNHLKLGYLARHLQFTWQRPHLLLTAQRPSSTSYPVEVSGWDSSQSFFVEACKLEWDEETDKCLVLTHSLRPGAMIFLRLLQPVSADRSLPVAYRAQLIGVTAEGQQRFRLKQIQLNGDSKD